MSVRFEKTDAQARPIIRFAIGLVVVTLAVGAGLLLLLRVFERGEVRNDPPVAPLARHEPGRQPPEPRLQVLPFADVERLRLEQGQILGSYGWVDRKAGVVRIPIEQAMRQLAERGLPSRPAPGREQ